MNQNNREGRSAALILLFDDAAAAGKVIDDAQASLAALNWNYEMILVPLNEQAQQLLAKLLAEEAWQDQPVRLLARQTAGDSAAVRSAIQSSSKDWIAVADAKLVLDDLQWQWLARTAEESDICCFFRKDMAGSWLTRLLLAVAAFVTKLLLKTGAIEDYRSVTFFRRDRISVNELESAGRFANTEIMARARLNQRSVIEFGMDQSVGNSDWENRLKAKQVLRSIASTIQFWWNTIMFPQSTNALAERNWTAEKAPVSRTLKISAWLSLIVAALALLSFNLSYPLFEPDEARNAQIGLGIYQSGQWMTLSLANEPYWDKPPLVAWATATCYHLFGVHESSTRLPCNISAFLTVMVTFLLGQRLIGFRAAWIGAILLLLSGGFVMAGRYVTMDASLTLCTTTLLLSGYLACRGNRFSHGWWTLAGIACGVGLLVKGPVIGVVGLPPLLIAMGMAGNKFLLRPRNWLGFIGPMILIAGPWYIAMSIAFFPDFMIYFFWKHHVVRFSDAFNHRAPFWYYLPVMFLVMYPASTMFPSLLAFLFSRKQEFRQVRSKELGFLLLVAMWVVGFFSLSQSKLPTYVLPSFPAICLLLGSFLDTTVFSKSWAIPLGSWIRIMPRRVAATLAILIVVAFAAFAFVRVEVAAINLAKVIAIGAILFLLTGIACLARQRSVGAWGSAALVGLLFINLSLTEMVPRISQLRSIHAAASAVRIQPEHIDSPVVFYRHENFGSSLWSPLNNQIVFGEGDEEAVRTFLQDHPRSILVSSDGPIEELQKSLGWSVRLLPVEDRRHVYVIKRSPEWIGQIDRGEARLR